MLDVAACFWAIAQTRGVRRALARVAGRELTDVDMMRLTVLAFLHDVGKANSGFQAKWWRVKSQALPPGWPFPAGHTHEALCIFGSENLLAQLPVNEMDAWGPAYLSLWRASISHHGKPVEASGAMDSKFIWSRVVSEGQVVYDPQATLKEIGQCAKKWFPSAFESGPALPDNAEFAHFVDADPGLQGHGSPAHAGIGPRAKKSPWALWGFPRACGDRPKLGMLDPDTNEVPPRTRG